MHGLINRAIENFLRDTYGFAAWHDVRLQAALPFDSFEPLKSYPAELTGQIIAIAGNILGRSPEALLEDMGTHLVSHRAGERLRRLLRFGGISFRDFLHSLEELPARARLALPELELPEMQLSETARGCFSLQFRAPFAGSGHLMMGLLRAMADDYGALVLLDVVQGTDRFCEITIQLLDEAHAKGRSFHLAAG